MQKDKLDVLRKKDNFGMGLKLVMTAKDISVKEIAKHLMVTECYVYYINQNHRKPGIHFLSKLLEYFKLTEEQFMDIIDYYNNYKGEEKYTYALLNTLKIILGDN